MGRSFHIKKCNWLGDGNNYSAKTYLTTVYSGLKYEHCFCVIKKESLGGFKRLSSHTVYCFHVMKLTLTWWAQTWRLIHHVQCPPSRHWKKTINCTTVTQYCTTSDYYSHSRLFCGRECEIWGSRQAFIYQWTACWGLQN